MDKRRIVMRVAMVATAIWLSLAPLISLPNGVVYADGIVNVSNVTQIYTQSQRSAKGLGVWPDSTLGVLQNGSSYQWFGGNGAASGPTNSTLTSGSLTDPAATVNYTSNSLGGLPANTFNYADIGPVYKDSASNIITFVHLERWPGGNYPSFWGSIGMAVSKDNGSTWSFCGEIIQHSLAYDSSWSGNSHETSNGNYQIVNDGGTDYFYVYATDRTSDNSGGGIGVSRATVTSVTGAADASTCTAPTFHKWYNSAWSSSPAAWLNGTSGIPQGGPYSDILSAYGQYSSYDGEENITYNSYLGQYILAYNPSIGTCCYGIGLRLSNNLLDFSQSPDHLVAGDTSHDAQYPTFVGEGSNPQTTTGQEFYLYYIQWSASGSPWDSTGTFQRATITVSNISDSYKASTGFSSTQGQNQWSYQYSTNGEASFTNSTWDATYNTWDGAGGYSGFCVITSNGQHAGIGCDPVRVWTAPSAGTVTLGSNGSLSVAAACGGNGVQIRILKNGTQIWPTSGWQTIANGASYNFPSSVTTSVSANDKIQFVVAAVGSNNYCDYTTWDQTVTYSSYLASTGFSSTQGQNQWSYQYSTNGEASFTNSTWDATYNTWDGAGGYSGFCVITSNGQHAGIGCDPVRVWTAPSAGTVTLGSNGSLSVAAACGGNGVQIRILKNGTQIWPTSGWQTIANGASYNFPSSVTTSVSANDKIQFVVAAVGSNNYCDYTTWDQTVTYS